MSVRIHPRVELAASTISRAVHGKLDFSKATDGSCVIYDGSARIAYIVHHRTGIQRIYEGRSDYEASARKASDAMLRASGYMPSLISWGYDL